MLHQQIKEEIKKAMLARDTEKLGVVRGLSAAFMNELVAKNRKPQEELNDEEALTVIKRAVKQRKDSIEQFKAGGRSDLVQQEEKELKILETYLPETISKEEIKALAVSKQKELNITDKTKKGQFMGILMKELKGKADGTDVKEVVDELFG